MEYSHTDFPSQHGEPTPEQLREYWTQAGQAAMMVSDVFSRAARTGLPVSPELGRLADEMLALLADEKIALAAAALSTGINDFFEEAGLSSAVSFKLRDNGINTLEDLLTISELDLRRINRYISVAQLGKIVAALADRGLKLRSEK